MEKTSKTELRPTVKVKDSNNPIEEFQNKVLRPILKLQNDLLLKFFNTYVEKNKIELTKEDLFEQIKAICQKNNVLKNQLTGIVLGLLDNDEPLFYFDNTNELNKRIIQMAIQRIYDNLKTNFQ